MGYRYFDTKHIKPEFPFGFGLSYTTFKYSNLKVVADTTGGKYQANVSYTITNTGKKRGADVSQVYVHEQHPKINRPYKELKGFARVELKPCESKTIHLKLNKGAFEYWSPKKNNWAIDPTIFDILVGSSSANILLKDSIKFKD